MMIYNNKVMDAIDGDASALHGAFVWGQTPQGHEYWAAQAYGEEPIDVAALEEMIGINGDRDELAGAFVWSTWYPRDPELTSPYGDNNPPVERKRLEEVAEELCKEIYGDKPKTWGDMTDAEKGALLLAKHEGKVIQSSMNGKRWVDDYGSGYSNAFYIRIKPEPKRETVTLYWSNGCGGCPTFMDEHTHRITFDLIDGEPDTSSIRMEKL